MPTDPKKAKSQPAKERTMPVRDEIERAILGAVLLESDRFSEVLAKLQEDDFGIHVHRKIFRCMNSIYTRAEAIDSHILANELLSKGELQACGGLAFINTLTDGLPEIPALTGYLKIVKDVSALRRVLAIASNAENAVYGGQTAQEIIGAVNDQLLDIQTGAAQEVDITPFGIIQSYPGGMDEFMDPSKQEVGLSTGFTQFDDMTAGLQPEDLIIVGGRPSAGKTALALTIAEHVTIKLKKRVVIFSLEMSRVQNLRRMICSLARVDYKKFRMGFTNAHEREKLSHARNWLIESKLLIDADPVLTLAGFRSKINKIVKKYGTVDLAIVDYLQLMSSTGKQENRNQEVSAQARGLKLSAKEYGIPIMALSQLSRAVDTRKGDHRPMLSDLRESGAIEQDADLVGFVFRGEMYDKTRDELKGKAELIVAKQRNGSIGTVDLAFLGYLMRFENLSYEEYEHGD